MGHWNGDVFPCVHPRNMICAMIGVSLCDEHDRIHRRNGKIECPDTANVFKTPSVHNQHIDWSYVRKRYEKRMLAFAGYALCRPAVSAFRASNCKNDEKNDRCWNWA